jgi:FlaA1/EpsC-like NDP-sugar epimerase
VIAGGTGELGSAIVEWMIYNRGVKNVVLLSRSEMSTKQRQKSSINSAKLVREL